MSSEQLNRTAVKDARLKDLLLERGTRLSVCCVCTGRAAASSVRELPGAKPDLRPSQLGERSLAEPRGAGEASLAWESLSAEEGLG